MSSLGYSMLLAFFSVETPESEFERWARIEGQCHLLY